MTLKKEEVASFRLVEVQSQSLEEAIGVQCVNVFTDNNFWANNQRLLLTVDSLSLVFVHESMLS